MKTSKEPRHKAKAYWEKSQRFARAARASAEAGEHDPAMSCAVNAIINLADALCVHYVGERSAGENHHGAVGLLSGVKDLDVRTREAIGKRLNALLSVKSLAQYEGELITAAEARRAIQDMERALTAAADVAKRIGWE